MGGQGNMSYKELSVSPDVRLPMGFKVPRFNLYDGCGDPVAHLRVYYNEMRSVREKDDLLMAYFSKSLTGAALDWHTRQDVGKWPILGDMAQDFVRYFQYRSGVTPYRSSLSKMEKKSEESFRKFGLRWREQTARVDTLIGEEEMVELFLQAQGPTYFSHLIPSLGKPFNDVLKMGELVEEGINLGGRKRNRKDDPMGFPDQHFHPRHRPCGYPYAPDNPPQCHFSPHNSQSRTSLSQYPAPQNAYLPLRVYRNPPGSDFRPNQAFKNERLQRKKTFTPLGESYVSLFQRLRKLDMLKPIQIKMPNPLPKKFDFSQRCAYCSDASGHDIEKCWNLKNAIQKLIDAGDIVVQNPDAADTSQSPSPVHNETHMVGMISFEKECENSSGILGGTRAAKLSVLSEVDPKNVQAKGTQRQSVKNNVMETCEGPSIVDAEVSS
ncbi:uncharacterized protein [Nicotiana sylvestris]|uniref:uncharacterized protein n=1 Tax=Nicotiana sylvestris TaxID=4096 RepID=UPI00388C3C4D